MATAKTTTPTNINTEFNRKTSAAKQRHIELVKKYKAEPKVRVTPSPFYKPYFGRNMPISINGISVYVPLDGQTYELPQSFANVFFERISRVDALIQKQGALSRIVEESYAGEVDLLGTVE